MNNKKLLATLIFSWFFSLALAAEPKVQWALYADGHNGTSEDIDMNLPEAWNITPGDDAIVVFSLSTGVNPLLPALRDTLWRNPLEIENNYIDDDKNGYVDDVFGINTITSNGDIYDNHGIGTVQASILRSDENSVGFPIGIMKRGKVIPCKFLDHNGSGSERDLIECLAYAEHLLANKDYYGIKRMVVHYGAGGGSENRETLEGLWQLSIHGAPVIAGAGSSAIDLDQSEAFHIVKYPVPNVSAGVGVLKDGSRASASNYGKSSLGYGLPFGDVWGVRNDGQLVNYAGSSLGSAMGAGVVALMLAQNPEISIEGVNQALNECGKTLESLKDQCASEKLLKADCLVNFAKNYR